MEVPKRSRFIYPDQDSSDEEQEVECVDEDDTFDDDVWASRLTRRFSVHKLPLAALKLSKGITNSPRVARLSDSVKGSPATSRVRHSVAIPALVLHSSNSPAQSPMGSPMCTRASLDPATTAHPLKASSTFAKPPLSPRKEATTSPRAQLPIISPRSSTSSVTSPRASLPNALLSPPQTPPGTLSPRASQSPLCTRTPSVQSSLSPRTSEAIPLGKPPSPRAPNGESKSPRTSAPLSPRHLEKVSPMYISCDSIQMSPTMARKLSAPAPVESTPTLGRLRSLSSPASAPPTPPARTAESRTRQQAIVQENLRNAQFAQPLPPTPTPKPEQIGSVGSPSTENQLKKSIKKPLPVPPVPQRKTLSASQPEDVEICAARIQRRFRMWSAQRRYRKMEILSTERTYVTTLRQIMTRYYEPIVKSTSLGLDNEDIKVMFGGLEVLLNVNSRLLASVEERMSAWSPNQRLGDLFLEMAAFLKTYTDYVKNFDLSLRRLADCSKNNQRFETFLRTTEEQEGIRTPLEALLITPVQRIPRYVLLLQQLHEHTPETHLDYEPLQKAIVQIKDVATYINEKKRESDNALRVVEIQSLLTGKAPNIIAAQRRFCHEGELSINARSGKKKKKRYWFLFNDIFVCTKPLTMKTLFSNKRKYKYQLFIALHGADLLEQEGSDTGFVVSTSSHLYDLYAETPEQKTVWMEKLNDAIVNLRNSERFYEERASKLSQEKAKSTKAFINNQYSLMRVQDTHNSFPSPERKRSNSATSGPYIVAKPPPTASRAPLEEEPQSPDEKEFTEFLAKGGGQRDKFTELLKRLVGKSTVSPISSPDREVLHRSSPNLKQQTTTSNTTTTESRTSLGMIRRNSNATDPQITLIPPTIMIALDGASPLPQKQSTQEQPTQKQPPQRSVSQPTTSTKIIGQIHSPTQQTTTTEEQEKRLSQEEVDERRRKAKSFADVATLKAMMLQELGSKCKRGEAVVRV